MMKRLLVLSIVSMLLLLAACGGSNDTVKIGTQTYTDPKIMAHIIEALIEDRTDLSVDITKDIAASPQLIAAVKQGDLDIAATLFSGEVYNNHFDGVEFTTDPALTIQQAQEGFAEHFNFTWYDSIGFENAYAIAVSAEIAEKYDPKTISDLEEIADELRFGTDSSWLERPNDGYRAFKEHYGYEFGSEQGMQVRLMYEAIENDNLDAITAYTVDPQILQLDMRVLEDDKHFFPPYDASVVASNDILEEHPELNEILQLLVGKIDTATMTQLISKVDIEGQNEKQVAIDFLKEIGLLN